jgi:RNA polymerase sigma-70 factor (ECF subfamily)
MTMTSISIQHLDAKRRADSAGARDRSRQEPSDRQLVERAQRGDRAAFGALYQRHVDDVFAYVRLRVRDTSLAEDLTQDVFVSTFKALPNFRWRGAFAPWLMRCAHNRVANHWRSLGRRPNQVELPTEGEGTRPFPELSEEPSMVSGLDERIEGKAVDAALARLTDLQRQVVALRFGAGLSLAETADVMRRSENAVKNLQHNALVSLRSRLVPTEPKR